MKPAYLLVFAIAATASPLYSQRSGGGGSTPAARVPVAPREDSSSTYFGTRVADPYRWLERYEDAAVRGWYEQEDAVTRAALERLPAYRHIVARLAQARNARPYRTTQIAEQPGRAFYLKALAGEQAPSLYVRDTYSGERRLIGPVELARVTGARTAVVSFYGPSPSGAHVAVSYTENNNERPATVIVETSTGRVLTAELPRSASGVSWLPGGASFLYSMTRDAPASATAARVWGAMPTLRHVVGTPVASDVVVFEPHRLTGDSSAIGGPEADAEAGIALATIYRENTVRTGEAFIAPLGAVARGATPPPATWRRVTSLTDSIQRLRVRGPWLYAASFRGAPAGRLVRLPIPAGFVEGEGPALDWSRAEVLLERPGLGFFNTFDRLALARDAVYWLGTDQGRQRMYRWPYDAGEVEEIPFPFDGSAGQLEALDQQPGVRFVFGGWTQADRRFRYDPGARRIVELPTPLNAPDPFGRLEGMSAETVFAPSHDGTRVPLTILRGFRAAGPQPTVLYGYGAYGATDDAFFRPQIRPWLEAGGTYAICHVRGGGYNGETWHRAGMQETKRNSWMDGIACAEYLLKQGLTTSAMLGINGGSAGGIFAGRAITERPELFGAAAIEVGVADMPRLMGSGAGPQNVHEFGSAETEAGFRALLAMSPYHHVQRGTAYPPTLLYAAFNDTRVTPWHPAKLAAALRDAGGAAALPGGERRVLLRVDFEAGHMGDSQPADVSDRRAAAVFAFFADRLGLRIPAAPSSR
ncbi:MAG TPA: prolyl oligopeptidase family serine peptidase [Longimicrobium sp.]|jgi:prolyl oligopeptidase